MKLDLDDIIWFGEYVSELRDISIYNFSLRLFRNIDYVIFIKNVVERKVAFRRDLYNTRGL